LTSPEDQSGTKHGRDEVASRLTIHTKQCYTTIEGQTYAATREGVHEKPDNYTLLPGKNAAVKDSVKKVQKFTLNDYLRHLHAKFCEENPDARTSLSIFGRHDRNTVH